ncbi:REP-associated tyrosine transposase [Piscinibacter sakaiensis]|uniref:REP-associated tyrosine transposase n=1 Tax=Piscinibacter sakaiensis TaxID=1547922 RepID=UPI003AAB36DE
MAGSRYLRIGELPGSWCSKCAGLTRNWAPVRSLAWVVMPDHWHWLLQLNESPDEAFHLSEAMRAAKGRSALEITTVKRTGKVWQAGYHDHALREDEDLQAIARYVIANPGEWVLADDIGGFPPGRVAGGRHRGG